MNKLIFFIFAASVFIPGAFVDASDVVKLRCEYRKNPLGIDVVKPQLSWIIEAEERSQESGDRSQKVELKTEGGVEKSGDRRLTTLPRGLKQTAYQILVASSEELLKDNKGDLWESGKVESDQQTQIEYAGKPLQSFQQCFWKVKIWLNKDNTASAWSKTAFWTMGLLKPSDWQAKWISLQDTAIPLNNPEKVTVTKATYRTPDGKVAVDVTPILKQVVADKRLPFNVEFNKLGGDPAPGVVKELLVEYILDGKPGVSRALDFQPLMIPQRQPGIPAPWFRKTFDLASAPGLALVSLNSTGYVELYINGQKAGTDVLTPAVTEDSRQTLYVTYNVTKLLKKGRNSMALWLGRGWASGTPQVRAQLNVLVDGRKFAIGTDASWKGRSSSYSHIGKWQWGDFGGESFDARDHVAGWNLPEFNDDKWGTAKEGVGPKGLVLAQQAPLNRIGAVISPVKITDLGAGSQELDFGTNLTGWLKMKMPPLMPGTKIRFSFADARNVEAKKGKSGYQTFNQVSRFVSAGGKGEVFENKFNYAGFRYVIIEGLPSVTSKDDVCAMLVESDLETIGSFDCSNELFNRIHRLTQWTQRCLNLGGYYVDCPTRERLGYGDGQVTIEGFMTSFAASEFYRKWLRDWRLRQGASGQMPNVAPTQSGGGGPAWAGLLAATTWRHYLYYGDKRILEENYDAIRRYVDYLESKCKDGILRKYGGQWDFIGDWVAPGRGMDTKNWPGPDAAEFFNNCYRIYQWELLANMAAALGRDADLARCKENLKVIRPIIHSAFYDAANKRYVIDEQAYYVMPLMTGVTPEAERAAVLENLEKNILVKNKGHLDTGMLGTYFMMEYLREIKRNDLVFAMFNQTSYPGYGTTNRVTRNGFWGQLLRLAVEEAPVAQPGVFPAGAVMPNAHVQNSTAFPAATHGNYRVPGDNPFHGFTTWHNVAVDSATVRTEIFATGLRNPFRWSFDPPTGRIFLADVGQGTYEEVNIIAKGNDMGWSWREGLHAYTSPPAPTTPPGAGFNPTSPIYEYDHTNDTTGPFEPDNDPVIYGTSITGGIVYRGGALSELYGKYIFADYNTGIIAALTEGAGGVWTGQRLATDNNIADFGVHPGTGEMLMCDLTAGSIKRLARSGTSGTAPPPTLSATGVFSNVATLAPNAGVVAYAPNVDFWSDHAIKSRWFAIRNLTDKVGFSAEGNWTLPAAMVWVKHFDIDATRGNPATRRKLETRILVKTPTDVYGLSYKWRADQTNADLVAEDGLSELIASSSSAQTWRYPSRIECRVCHTAVGGHALSFNTRQMNRTNTFGAQTLNQITALSGAGYFSAPVSGVNNLPAFAAASDTAASREWRVRCYLAVNCISCHQPGGAATGNWDARSTTPTDLANLIGGMLVNNGGDALNRWCVAGDTAHSTILNRLSGTGFQRMPPLGTNERDIASEQLISDWITLDLPSRQSFSQWTTTHFPGGGANSQPGADPDGDGETNSLEFLRRTSPLLAQAPFTTGLDSNAGLLSLTFDQPAGRGALIETSVDMRNWSLWDMPGNQPNFPASTTPRLFTAPQDLPSRFFRLRLMEP